MNEQERNRFEAWQRAWDTAVPKFRMDKNDDEAPRKLLNTRDGIYRLEEMHIRDEAGLPLGELRLRRLVVDGLVRDELTIELDPDIWGLDPK